MTESHSWCWMKSLKCHGPIRKFPGNSEAILALALRTRDNGFLSWGASPHPNGRDGKSWCSPRDSQNAGWVSTDTFHTTRTLIIKLVKLKGSCRYAAGSSLQNWWRRRVSRRWSETRLSRRERPRQAWRSPSSVAGRAWLTSGVEHVFAAVTVPGAGLANHTQSKFHSFGDWIQTPF